MADVRAVTAHVNVHELCMTPDDVLAVFVWGHLSSAGDDFEEVCYADGCTERFPPRHLRPLGKHVYDRRYSWRGQRVNTGMRRWVVAMDKAYHLH